MTRRGRLLPALIAATALAACQQDRTPTQQRAASSAATISLTSQRIILPDETATLPPDAAIITTNCTACHSPDLILTQPKLKPETWMAEVTKMRTAYKATIDARDDAKIVAALVALQRGSPQK